MANVVLQLEGDPAVTDVLSVRGSEGVNRLPEWEIAVTIDDPNLDLKALLRTPAWLTLVDQFGGTRPLAAMVIRAEFGGARGAVDGGSDGVTYVYRFGLSDPRYAFTKRSGHRIFQDLSTRAIIESLHKELGLAETTCEWRVARELEKRTYCVQYDETEWTFIQRLAAEEGLRCWLEMNDDGESVLTFTDSPDGADAIIPNANTEESDVLMFAVRDAQAGNAATVSSMRREQALPIDAIDLVEERIEKPDAPLSIHAGDGPRTVYDYPARLPADADLLPDGAETEKWAQARLEQLNAGTDVATAVADCARLQPGRVVTIGNTGDEELDGHYLILEVEHQWLDVDRASSIAGGRDAELQGASSAQGWGRISPSERDARATTTTRSPAGWLDAGVSRSTSATAVTSHDQRPLGRAIEFDAPLVERPRPFERFALEPLDDETQRQGGVTCKMARLGREKFVNRMPWPVAAPQISGVDTAKVTGPNGEEIHVDHLGSVTVAFPWDRSGIEDDKSSRFIRTMQMNQDGSMLLPRMGWEVILAYRDGRPRVPLCLGRTYNAVANVPYPLPANKATMAWKSATSPGDGTANEMVMSDVKGKENFGVHASGGHALTVGGDATIDVAVDRSLKVVGKLLEDFKATFSCDVGGNYSIATAAGLNIKVNGARTTMVSAVDSVDSDKNHAVKCSLNVEAVGGLHFVRCNQFNETLSAGLGQLVGAAMVVGAGLGVNETVVGVRTETCGGPILVQTSSMEISTTGLQLFKAGAVTINAGAKVLDKAKVIKLTAGATQLTGNLFIGAPTIKFDAPSVKISGGGTNIGGSLSTGGKIVSKAKAQTKHAKTGKASS